MTETMTADNGPIGALLMGRAALAERAESNVLRAFVGQAPSPVREALGISALQVGGGVVLAASNDPSQYWSKALGFGIDEPITAELV